MELLQEAKKGNKEAFKQLTEDLEIKLYKTARYYFTAEEDVIYVMKVTMKKLFKEIVNAKTEDDIVPLAMKFLIKYGEELHLKKSRKKGLAAYITVDNKEDVEYRRYRDSSVEEEYITSLNKELRLISILYYYDGLTSRQIANILKMSARDVESVIDQVRDRLYEMISNEGAKKYNEYVK